MALTGNDQGHAEGGSSSPSSTGKQPIAMVHGSTITDAQRYVDLRANQLLAGLLTIFHNDVIDVFVGQGGFSFGQGQRLSSFNMFLGCFIYLHRNNLSWYNQKSEKLCVASTPAELAADDAACALEMHNHSVYAPYHQ
jgi:hypothetical protein